MPLVIITGFPSSGKTYRAQQILVDFKSRVTATPDSHKQQRSVAILPSHHAASDPVVPSENTNTTTYVAPAQDSNPRDQIYNSASREKTARAEEFSAIKRALSKNHVVIADGLNYIKGLRYQLWCEAKAAGTRCVVVHVAAREEECIQWNEARLEAWKWQFESDTPSHENIKGPKIGRDVMGDLEPESHTAIYGDRMAEYSSVTRSRSSSMDGDADDVSDNDRGAKHMDSNPEIDRMTLKSLYISGGSKDSTPPALIVENETRTRKDDQPEHVLEATSLPPPDSSLPYSPSTLRSLVMRYEPPSPFTRWDTPLFTIPSADAHPPYESIWNTIFPPPTKLTSKKALSQQPRSASNGTPTESEGRVEAVRQHAATMLPQATSSEALQILESSTADVVKHLLSAAREQGLANGEGGQLTFSVPTTAVAVASADISQDKSKEISVSVRLPMNTPLTQPMLQRLRRKYTQIQRGSIAHGKGYASGREDVVRTFVGFLAAEWGD